MSFERTTARVIFKPWGRYDLGPWNGDGYQGAVGELLFERTDPQTPDPSLLLKLLFTRQDLSIQVHPDDDCAKKMGMANGKTEAWYVLAADEDARVGIGLGRPLTKTELKNSIADGSIADLVDWRIAGAGDAFFVKAGTIHGIGAGLVIAEIQQRSDTTFRLFDHGRSRDLHADQAVVVADLALTKPDAIPINLTVERIKLVSCPFFVFERVHLPPKTAWEIQVECETWALVIGGEATIGFMRARVGDAFYADEGKTAVAVGGNGVTILLAYAASIPYPNLLRELDDEVTKPRAIDQAKSVVLPFGSTEIRL